MGRPPCCDRSNVKRGPWTPEEDAKILAYVATHGTGNWTVVPKKAGLNRCGKSCRLRWTNYLRPDLKHDNFTPEEEQLIINLHEILGSRWSFIARNLPGRTDNDVKNYWNTKLRKKLEKMGIDPITHKPFTQILSDIGSFGDISNTGNQNGSFNRAMVSKLIPKPEPSSVLTELSGSNMFLNPMIEHVQDNSSNINNNHSFEFLSQFQINNSEAIQPQFFSEVNSTCSSSSSTPFTHSQPETTPSSPYMWSEFLVSDPVFSLECHQQEERNLDGMFIPTKSTLTQKETLHCKFNNGCDQLDSRRVKVEVFKSYGHEGTGNSDQGKHYHADAVNSLSANSFVESILDKDREMLSQFPQLLDPSFDY